MKKKSLAIFILVASLGVYIGTYLVCTLNGEYVPGAFGAGHVKWYSWAPNGLVNETTHKWSPRFSIGFAPMLWLDWKFLHRSEDYDGEWYNENTSKEHDATQQ